ncbi:hypothetical protein TrLO_g1847 [Triparma laevis f. longispina]|uniref:RRM domain-containing protein n=1 Tax=Triparma laevis f. longispina TaxID=1714387 RepID=A0A9W7AD75_9STRA|nr:hypothetical protein TrLO_g1847 [Triparma laevis f. longispina]
MGNGIPAKLPTTEEHWDKAQKVMDRLETAMLEQQKKELNPDVLEGAIDVAESRGFNRTNNTLVARAEGLQSLVQHKFAEKLVADYKEKWEWAEAEKEPEGELMMRKLAEKAEAEAKSSRRKNPEKRFNFPTTNNPLQLLKVENLSKITTEIMLHVHFDKFNDHKAGNFTRCHIVRNEKNECTGIAFLEYPDEKQLKHALELQGSLIDYDNLDSSEYGVDGDDLGWRNTVSFLGEEGWLVGGEGLMFEDIAEKLGLAPPKPEQPLSPPKSTKSGLLSLGSPKKDGRSLKKEKPVKPPIVKKSAKEIMAEKKAAKGGGRPGKGGGGRPGRGGRSKSPPPKEKEKEKTAKEKTVVKEKSVKEKSVKEKSVKEPTNPNSNLPNLIPETSVVTNPSLPSSSSSSSNNNVDSVPAVSKSVPKSVNKTIVMTHIKGMQISKKLVYNGAEEVIGKIVHTPRIVDFAFHSINKGKDWKKVWFSEDMMKEGGPKSVEATGLGSAVIETAANGWKFETKDFGLSWVRLSKKPEVAEKDNNPNNNPTEKKKRRKKRKITLSVPDTIPTPPSAPSILRCIKVRVDGLSRVVKAHFYPPFNDLFKAPQSEQKIKDKGLILDYIAAVRSMEDVTWLPSGVAQVTSNPWNEKRVKGKDLKKYEKEAIQVCSICNGCAADHSICIRNFNLAKHGMEMEIEI